MLRRLLCVLVLAGCSATATTDPTVEMRPTPEPQISSAPTTPSTTTTPPTTTNPQVTTTVAPVDLVTIQEYVATAQELYGRCGEWHDLAIAVGWPESEWPTLSYVLHRESRCDPSAHNKSDPGSGSRGLMQVNSYWCRPSKFSQNGWLQDRNVLSTCDQLFDAKTNLHSGLLIWLYGEQKHGCGWRGPWATPCR